MLNIMTYEQIETFLAAHDYTDQTIVAYRYCLHRLETWLQGRSLDILDPATLRRFMLEQGWGSNMQHQVLSALRSYLRHIERPDHPAFRLPLPADRSGPQRTPTARQLTNLLQSIDTSTPIGRRNLAMLCLMLETGLRSSEVCRLSVDRLDLASGSLTVLAKGRQWRIALFSRYTAACLESWLAYRQAAPGVKAVFVSLGGIIPGHPLTASGMRVIFCNLARQAGMPALSPHDLRRAMAVLYTEAGLPTRTLQELGGWSDIRLVERYTRKLAVRAQTVERYSPVYSLLAFDDS